MGKSRAEMAFERFRGAWARRDAAAIANVYAEDAVMVTSGEAPPVRGRKAIQLAYAAMLSAFPDLKSDFMNLLAVGDRAFAEFRNTGAHTGLLSTPNGDVQPTGRRLDFRGAFYLRVNPKGEIVEDHTYFDTAEFTKQLGIA